MSKVKLTREQEEALEKALSRYGKDLTVIRHAERYFLDEDGYKLTELTTAEVAKALYIGYEVEETFEVGDCVVLDDGQIVEIIEEEAFTFIVGWIANGSMYRDRVSENRIKRHATKQEKWWAKHGRNVWTLKRGDVLKSRNIKIMECVESLDYSDDGEVIVNFSGGNWEYFTDVKRKYDIVCFSEDRKDVDHAE